MAVLSPLRVAVFRRLIGSYALNELVWGLGTVALAIVVYERTNSAAWTTALFLSATGLPALISPLLTAVADRVDPRRALPAAYAVESVLFAALALGSESMMLPLMLVLVCADGAIALSGRGLTRGCIAAALEDGDELERGNALVNIVFSVCFAVSPALGAGAFWFFGPTGALLGCSALFVINSAMLASAAGLGAERDPVVEPWRQRLVSGLTTVQRQPLLRSLLTLQAVGIAVVVLISPIEVIYVAEALEADTTAYGLLLAAWGLGSVGGSVAYTRCTRVSPAVLVSGAFALQGAGLAVLAGAPMVAVALIGSLLGGIGNGIGPAAVYQQMHARVAPDAQARVIGLLESAQAAALAVGYLGSGLLASVISLRAVFAVAAMGVTLLALVSMVVLTRRLPSTALPEPAPA